MEQYNIEYLCGIEAKELIGMSYKVAIKEQLIGAKALYKDLYYKSKDDYLLQTRMYYVGLEVERLTNISNQLKEI